MIFQTDFHKLEFLCSNLNMLINLGVTFSDVQICLLYLSLFFHDKLVTQGCDDNDFRGIN